MTRILIVDDDAAYRNSLRTLLDLCGFETQVAADADEAIRLADQLRPDLLVIDWMLNDYVDGLEVARMLRAGGLRAPLVVISGYPSSRIESQIAALPRAQFLPKPFSTEVLLATIETATKGGIRD